MPDVHKTVRDEETSVGGRRYIYKPCPCPRMRRRDDPRRCAGRSVVALNSGHVYEVAPDDTSDTALWNAGDGVPVCGDKKMINKDNGNKAHVTRMR